MRDQRHAPGSPTPREPTPPEGPGELLAVIVYCIVVLSIGWAINQTDCTSHQNAYCDYQQTALARHQKQ